MTTAEQLLGDQGWRRRHSVYVLWALLFGFGFVSLLYTGIRAGRGRWITWGVIYGVLSIGALALGGSLAPDDPEAEYGVVANLAIGTWFIVWVVSAVHVFRARKDWLRWRAATPQQARWYESSTAPASTSAVADLGPLGLDDPTGEYLGPQRASPHLLPPTTPPASASRPAPPPPPTPAAPAPHAAPAPVDLNTAGLDEIAELPGVGVAAAHRIIDERTRHGGFSSVDEAAVAVNLPPHVRSRLQRTATVSPRQETRPRGSAGRIVDI